MAYGFDSKKADLNKDKKLSGYEKKRGMAIQQSIAMQKGNDISNKMFKANGNFKKNT